MITIFDIGIIGTSIVGVITLLNKNTKRRDNQIKLILLILSFFVILKLMSK